MVTQALWDACAAHNRQPLIAIDEADLLSSAMLEEIRLVTNFHMDSASPIGLCLVGQPELRQRFRLRAFEAISQRATLRFHLGGLPEPETNACIGHHLKVAGVTHPLFSDEAIHLIRQCTQGHPPAHQQRGRGLRAGGLRGAEEPHRQGHGKKASGGVSGRPGRMN